MKMSKKIITKKNFHFKKLTTKYQVLKCSQRKVETKIFTMNRISQKWNVTFRKIPNKKTKISKKTKKKCQILKKFHRKNLQNFKNFEENLPKGILNWKISYKNIKIFKKSTKKRQISKKFNEKTNKILRIFKKFSKRNSKFWKILNRKMKISKKDEETSNFEKV